MTKIKIRGARTHNLKNINLTIPRNKLVVITGLSGSGKSSLAFDTLYAEGQRRYVESLSAYARQFLSLMEKPDVDYIGGLSPAISIEQKSTLRNPRSTVGTITEIQDYLRLLFARIGEPRCPIHNISLAAQTISQMVDKVLEHPEGKIFMLLAPIIKERKGEYAKMLENLARQGYTRARIDNKICDLTNPPPKLKLQQKHTIEVIVDRFQVYENIKARLAESFEIALKLSGGTVVITAVNSNQKEELFFSAKFACPICGYSMRKLEPSVFSFNNPAGACQECDGLGIQQHADLNRVIQNPSMSLANGVICGWNKHNFYYSQILQSLAEHYKFNIETPWTSLDVNIQKIILFGSGGENIKFRYINDCGDISIRNHPFEGILNNIERRYKESESSTTVRKKLMKFITNHPCFACKGTRLHLNARHVYIGNMTLPEISDMSIEHAINFFSTLTLSSQQMKIAEKVLKEINNRLQFLNNVGLNYLTLSRSTSTLSGGEAQRIRLASQISSGLVGVMYVLDEPSIGLHQRDNVRLLNTLTHLRNLGNTIIMVEHDEYTIRTADHIVDIGPGAGTNGGHVVAEGSLKEIMAVPNSLTGQYMSGKRKIETPKQRVPIDPQKMLKLSGANGNNLKDITLTLPIGLFTCITGVSGSGKSTLICDTLLPLAQMWFDNSIPVKPAPYKEICGLENFNRVVDINQNPIGRTPRSNPATYTNIFAPVRELFANVPESRSRGYSSGRFSFNIRGGRCEACQGAGVIKVEMHFLPDIYVSCDQCQGKRYNRETLEIKYKGKTIHEVLEMTIQEARKFFNFIPAVSHKLQTLIDVGLTYIKLGQTATTLSGGESQRVKLAYELSKRTSGRTLYILDEPTTGLHFADIQQLLSVLYQLRDYGNTIIVIEHNLEVIKTADWIIDLGPEGGNSGGKIIVSGTPETIIQCERSHTAQFLKPLLH